MKLIKNMKMVVGLGATVAMFAIAPVVYGGITWSGIDPIFTVDGYKFNVKIEYPSQYDCDFDDEVEVVVTVPKGASTEFVSESQGELSGCEQGTSTSIEESSFSFGRLVKIEVNASSEQSFPIKVKVDVNGQPYRVYNGESNRQISGPALSLYEVDAGSYFSDPSDSDADEDPLVYTYNEDDEDDAIIWDQFFSDDGD